jgi:hypothetical protein
MKQGVRTSVTVFLLSLPLSSHAATEDELAAIRQQMESLQKQYETQMKSLETRLEQAEAQVRQTRAELAETKCRTGFGAGRPGYSQRLQPGVVRGPAGFGEQLFREPGQIRPAGFSIGG